MPFQLTNARLKCAASAYPSSYAACEIEHPASARRYLASRWSTVLSTTSKVRPRSTDGAGTTVVRFERGLDGSYKDHNRPLPVAQFIPTASGRPKQRSFHVSIEKMIRLHPDVGQDLNEALAMAARHSMLCSLFCTSCADACLAEEMDMRQCVRTCMDCADVCNATAHLAVRRTGQNVELLRAQLEICIKACETCAAECGKHDHEHCKLCATMCRECAGDCRKALATVQ